MPKPRDTRGKHRAPTPHHVKRGVEKGGIRTRCSVGSAEAQPRPIDVPAFEKLCLATHNKYRAMHGCPPLKLNRDLCKFAKEWAEDLAKRDTMEHRKNPPYGENLYRSGGLRIDGSNAPKMWYDEIEKYNFETAEFSPAIGHFTQLIWKNTKDVGVAVVNIDDKYWVVANYEPPGNVVGQFKENVPRKKK